MLPCLSYIGGGVNSCALLGGNLTTCIRRTKQFITRISNPENLSYGSNHKIQTNTHRPKYSQKIKVKKAKSFISKNYCCVQYIIADNRNQTKHTIEEMVKKIMAQPHNELLDRNLKYMCEKFVITQQNGYILM